MFDPAEILIGVDGGGSGCRAALVCGARPVARAAGGAANFTSHPERTLSNVRAVLADVVAQAGGDIDTFRAARVHVGLAGVQSAEDARIVAAALPFEHCVVTDDRPTSVMGALGDRDGVLLAVGTGTIIARRRGATIRFVSGWGFQLSDQASGAWLGRKLLRRVLMAHDGLRPETDLTRAVMREHGGDPNALVRFAATATPRDFAQFAPQIVQSAQAGDATATTLMRKGAAFLEQSLEALGAEGTDPVCLSGGLGPHYAPYLSSVGAARLTDPDGNALDGALRLAATQKQRQST